MKTIDRFIYEKLRISKSMKIANDESIKEMHWVNFFNLSCALGLDRHSETLLKDSTNDDGDMWWFAVTNKDTKTTNEFFRYTKDMVSPILSTNKYGVIDTVEKKLGDYVKNIFLSTCDGFKKPLCVIQIDLKDDYSIIYIVACEEKDAKEAYEMLTVADSWQDYTDKNIYNMFI